MTDPIIPRAALKLSTDSGIYMIRCTANGKIYIGSAINLLRRWRCHKSNLRSNTHYNEHLQRAWNKYGEQAFTMTVLEKCNCHILRDREQFYLDAWQPFDEKGFNIARQVDKPALGRPMLQATKEKLSALKKGKVFTPEHRAKLRAAKIGHKRSSESVEKSAAAIRGRIVSPETRAKMSASIRASMTDEVREKIGATHRGKKASTETREKQSRVRKGKKQSAETLSKRSKSMQKHIYTVTSPDGKVTTTTNLPQFAQDHNISVKRLYDVVNGRKRSYKGWTANRIGKIEKE